MKNGMRKAGIASAMLAAAGAMVTVGGVETASAQAPRIAHSGGSGTATQGTPAKTTPAKTTPAKTTSGNARRTHTRTTHTRTTHTGTTHTGTTHTRTTHTGTTNARTTNAQSANGGSQNASSANAGSANSTSAKSATAAKNATSGNSATSAKSGKASSKGKAALQYAKQQLGKPYSFAAAGPGSFDCSGLTLKAWKSAAGVDLPHSAHKQLNQGPRVSTKNLKPGDLVFFYGPNPHHVGVYAGNGKVIDAPRPGTVVRYDPISSMPVAGATRPA